MAHFWHNMKIFVSELSSDFPSSYIQKMIAEYDLKTLHQYHSSLKTVPYKPNWIYREEIDVTGISMIMYGFRGILGGKLNERSGYYSWTKQEENKNYCSFLLELLYTMVKPVINQITLVFGKITSIIFSL